MIELFFVHFKVLMEMGKICFPLFWNPNVSLLMKFIVVFSVFLDSLILKNNLLTRSEIKIKTIQDKLITCSEDVGIGIFLCRVKLY